MNKSTWTHPLSHVASMAFGYCFALASVKLANGMLEHSLIIVAFASIGLVAWHRFIADLTEEKAKNHD